MRLTNKQSILGLGNISINSQYHLIKYPQYNYCMHLAFTISSPRQYLSHLVIIIAFSNNYYTHRLICVNSGPHILYSSCILALTMSIGWFVSKEVVFLNYFSVKTSTHTDITDFSNYVVVLQFFACNIAIIAINSSCNNRMSQIQYRPTLVYIHVLQYCNHTAILS